MPLPSTRVVHDQRAASTTKVASGTWPEVATIRRPTTTKDAAGGDTIVWRTVGTGVPCRMRAIGNRILEVDVADRTTETARWAISFDPATDVDTFDRITIGARTFDVLDGGVESYPAEVRTLCVEVAS